MIHIPLTVLYILAWCGFCAWATSPFPSTHSNAFVQMLLDIGNFFGGNMFRNKNKDDTRS